MGVALGCLTKCLYIVWRCPAVPRLSAVTGVYGYSWGEVRPLALSLMNRNKLQCRAGDRCPTSTAYKGSALLFVRKTLEATPPEWQEDCPALARPPRRFQKEWRSDSAKPTRRT